MQVFRQTQAAARAHTADTFTGAVHFSELGASETGTPVRVYHVQFASGARTHWHTHSGAQWLFVTEGRIRVQTDGQPPQDLEAGDAVVIAPGERHWHGAAPGSRGVHLAVNVAAETQWLDAVADEDYEPTLGRW